MHICFGANSMLARTDLFFFASRRRHTRSKRDWSSDVCSSDLGLGGDTGVVIEARMIDALLSDRPDDRRELFEEAAGIGLYRDRRRTTERRLEETAGDLQRLDDLIAEVQSQVRSLSRQRRRAERYSELSTRRFTVEIALAAREMSSWRDELARLETRVAELRATVPQSDEAVGDQERRRDAA